MVVPCAVAAAKHASGMAIAQSWGSVGVAGSDERLGLAVSFDRRLRGGRGVTWAPEAWGRASREPRPKGGYFQD